MRRADRELARYAEFCQAADADAGLVQFCLPKIGMIRRAAGWIVDGNPADIIYAVIHDGWPHEKATIHYTSAVAARRLQALIMSAFQQPTLPTEFATPVGIGSAST